MFSALTGQKEEGFLFRRSNGGPPCKVRTAFARACVVAKLETFRLYDLRHTCASWLVVRDGTSKRCRSCSGIESFKRRSTTLT